MGFPENRIHAVIYEIRSMGMRFEITGQLKAIASDPDDDKFIECAVVASASAIVSNDHHLLDLGSYQNVRIFSASEFVTHYQNQL